MKYNKFRNIGVSLAIVAAALLISSCSKNKSSNPSPPPPGGGHSSHFHSVGIQNLAYSPASLTIAAGDTVQLTNNDGVQHSVTADGGAFDSGLLSSGSGFLHVFGAAGSFPYHCTVHTFMHGSVTVQ